jgi:hypothetical protein
METVITLSNGKRVVNFSSPHPFEFVDGSILPAVSPEDAEKYKVTFIEEEVGDKGDISLSFSLSEEVIGRMVKLQKMWYDELVDVVFVPLPMLVAMGDIGLNVINFPFRAILIEDRIKKLISIDKQCI